MEALAQAGAPGGGRGRQVGDQLVERRGDLVADDEVRLGGQRAVLLMQSSGVGNCVNMFSLLQSCRFPFLTLVTMRGEYAEFNPWQCPMGRATQAALELMGITVLRASTPDEVEDMVSAGLDAAFEGGQQVAVLLSQRLIGRKQWERK